MRVDVEPQPQPQNSLPRISVCNRVLNWNSFQGEPGRSRNCSLGNFQDFRSLSKENHYFASSPEKCLWIFFSYLPGNLALNNGGDFWWIFSGLRFPPNEARKLLKKFGENSERNSGQNPGQKFENFGELSYCDFSDLKNQVSLPRISEVGVGGRIGILHTGNALRPRSYVTRATTNQKTRQGCGCFRGLFGGSQGKLRESPGKIAGKIFPNRETLQILGFRAPGKANLPGTLGRHCLDLLPTFRAGCFLKSTVPAFSSFSEPSAAIGDARKPTRKLH